MNDKNYSMTSQSIVGIVVLLLGVVLTLGNFDIINSSSVLRYWPALLVVFGAIRAVQPGRSSGRVFGIVIAGVGALMLLERMEVIWFELWDLWPLILILVGGSLMLRNSRHQKREEKESSMEYITGTAILGGIEQRNSSLYFKGGSVSAIMGGYQIDLRDADIPENGEAVFEVFALMGGIELKVPEDWSVVLEGSAFLGGFESKARGSGRGNKRFVIRGQAILGGVEVRS
jgi:predicted membrane protein